MRFLLMFKPENAPEPGTLPCKQNLPEMITLMEGLKKDGVLLSSDGLMPSDSGARITHFNGKLVVTDGPFAEAKEMIAGVAIIQVSGKAAAIDVAKRFLAIAGAGISDILEIMEPATAASHHD